MLIIKKKKKKTEYEEIKSKHYHVTNSAGNQTRSNALFMPFLFQLLLIFNT